ncbi:NO-inducible flavohemoprotein [Bacillus sp. FJAT-47783]|uniref:NO-inducible flavohemoprotein n=1 Tax=Bacillus sp. FJAT-47783 TaxID=2922712 RepID=UPI001FAD876A|nr:NO-inducible flavohemoprotein [Bacillus sp. FJAT-47783]
MLSKRTMEIIKSTAPILAERGQEITSHFYKRMFSKHPELLNIFNHANQHQGRQQTSLANALYAAAIHIDQLEKILPAVKQIAHKHRGLGVKKEHYPIVGENLLVAMKEVLGDGATDEVLKAWEEAYQVIAGVFIDVEEEMYQEVENEEGGWRYFKPFIVADKVKESDVITSFYLKPKDQEPLPSYLPGQYITIRVSIDGEEYLLNRQYSLSDAPGHDYYRISVKREADSDPKGKVSNWLHDKVNVGDEVELSPPAGDFILDVTQETPVVLISGGVGVTPMISMLRTITKEHATRPVTFIHSAKNEAVHAFQNEVKEAMETLQNGKSFISYADRDGFITKEILSQFVMADADYYICGPVPFMNAMIHSLQDLNVDVDRIHYEFFGPALTLEQMDENETVTAQS